MELRRLLIRLENEISDKIESGSLAHSQIDIPLQSDISAIEAEIIEKHAAFQEQNRKFALQELRKYQPADNFLSSWDMVQLNNDLQYFRQLESLKNGERKKTVTISANLEFATRVFASNSWMNIMRKYPEIWKNKALPWKGEHDIPIKLLNIKNDVLQIGIEMDEGALFRKKLSINSLTPEQSRMLIARWVLEQPVDTYKSEEKFNIGAWLFNNNMSDLLNDILERKDFFTTVEISQWRNFLDDLAEANNKINILTALVTISNDVQKKNWLKALDNSLEFQAGPFPSEYKEMASTIISKLLWHFSELHHYYFKFMAEKALEQRQFTDALGMIATAETRCPDKKMQDIFRRQKNTAVRDLSLPPGYNPFERQVNPSAPGVISKWLMENRKTANSNSAYQIVIAADLGERKKVQDLLRETVRLENTGNWQISLLYDYGLAATQFNETSAADYTTELLSENFPYHFTILKYGIATKNYSQTIRLAQIQSRHDSIIGYQAELARLLILIQHPEFSENDFRYQVAELRRKFSHLNLLDDFRIIDWCAEVFNNKKPANIPELESCREKELLAIMICDIAARDRYLDRGNLENAVLPVIPNDSCYYAYWWWRSALLSLTANGPSIINWMLKLSELELDYRIAALPSYSMLKQLKTAALIVTGQDKKSVIQDIIGSLQENFGENLLWQEQLVLKDLKIISSAGQKK